MIDSKGNVQTHINVTRLVVVCAFFMFVIVMLLSQNCHGQVNVNNILDRLTIANKRFPTCAMRVETRISSKPRDDEEVDATIYVYELRWDGDRFDVIQNRYSELAGERKQLFAVRNLWNGKIYQFKQQPLKDGPGQIWADVGSNPERKKHVESLLSSIYSGGFLSGNLSGDRENIVRRLKDSAVALHKKQEYVRGNSCYLMEAKSPNGHYRVWVDPNHGYNIRKAVIIRKPGDILNGSPIASGTSNNAKRLVGHRVELDEIQINKVNGRYIPISGAMVCTYFFNDGTEEQRRWEAKRSNIQLNPDFERIGAFVMEIENGTMVDSEDVPGVRYTWHESKKFVLDEWDGSIRYVPKEWSMLVGVGKPLLQLEGVKLKLSVQQTKNRAILICFFDMEQRPSRNCIMQLAKKAEQFKQKGVTIVAVQASKVNESTLNEWMKRNNVPFAVGMVQDDEEKTRFTWGVKSLPWLILTNKQHIVQAEGFNINELDGKIKALREK